MAMKPSDDTTTPVAPASDEVVAKWEAELADDYSAEYLLRYVSYDETRSIIARLRLEISRNNQESIFPPGLGGTSAA